MLTAQAQGHVELERALVALRVLILDCARAPQRWPHGCGR